MDGLMLLHLMPRLRHGRPPLAAPRSAPVGWLTVTLLVVALGTVSLASACTTQTTSPAPTPATAAVPTEPGIINGTTAPSQEFYAVDFLTAEVGWAAGAGGILVTRDGGEHWDMQHETLRGVADIDFLDAHMGFAIEPVPDTVGGSRSGGGDFLLATTDGGQHWQSAANWTPTRFTQIAFVSATAGWAIGYRQVTDDLGTLFHTNDGGQTWTEALSPAMSVCFGDQNVGWATSATEMKRTVDGGATWTQSFVNPLIDQGDKLWTPTVRCAGRDVAWLRLADGVAAGSEAYIIYGTVDGGQHWQPVVRGPTGPVSDGHVGAGGYPGPISVLDGSNVYAVTVCSACNGDGSSSIEVTHDGGTTWQPPVEIAGAGAFVRSLDFVDRDHGWLASSNGIFATADGGRTWTKQHVL